MDRDGQEEKTARLAILAGLGCGSIGGEDGAGDDVVHVELIRESRLRCSRSGILDGFLLFFELHQGQGRKFERRVFLESSPQGRYMLCSAPMRAYKFLDRHFGLKSLRERRLKISTLNDLNDPFELLPYKLSKRNYRNALRATRRELATLRGILCFSADWRDPVIWAHYSDKHRGICLGFEIPSGLCKRINCVPRRLPFPAIPDIPDAETMLFTKFSNWAYEQEIRVWAALNDNEDGLYYAPFGEMLTLATVIGGARCSLSLAEVREALGPLGEHVTVIKARAGFERFEIVKDKRGWQT